MKPYNNFTGPDSLRAIRSAAVDLVYVRLFSSRIILSGAGSFFSVRTEATDPAWLGINLKTALGSCFIINATELLHKLHTPSNMITGLSILPAACCTIKLIYGWN